MYQPVRELDPFRLRDDLHEILFHFFGRFGSRQTQPVRQPENVRVHHNAGGNSIGGAQNNVRRFASDAGERQEFLHRFRDRPFELRQEPLSSSLDILGFVSKEAGRMDELLQIRKPGVGEVSRSWIPGEKCGRYQVHANIRALSGEDRRHQQLERVPMVQRTPDVRVFILQPFENLFYWHFRFLQNVLRPVGSQVRRLPLRSS